MLPVFAVLAGAGQWWCEGKQVVGTGACVGNWLSGGWPFVHMLVLEVEVEDGGPSGWGVPSAGDSVVVQRGVLVLQLLQ